MAEIVDRTQVRSVVRGSMDWGAVWAGLFTFISIWSVFGLLGIAIFATNSGQPLQRVSGGLAIWTVILTIVAMFIAGHQTGRVAGLDGRFEGMQHGVVMFGLSIAAAIVLTMGGSLLFSGIIPMPVHGANVSSMFADSGWVAFFALFLGWIAAMLGASSGVTPKVTMLNTNTNVRDIRPAA